MFQFVQFLHNKGYSIRLKKEEIDVYLPLATTKICTEIKRYYDFYGGDFPLKFNLISQRSGDIIDLDSMRSYQNRKLLTTDNLN